MKDVTQKINKIAEELSSSYRTNEDIAKASLGIFIIGCYCSEHKPFLIKLRDKIIGNKVACMLMSDIDVSGIDNSKNPDYSIKFRMMCDKALKSFRMPLIFMYASISSNNCGGGANIELVTICENQKYEKLKANFRIFSESGANLPHQRKHILFNVPVKNGDDFVTTALGRLEVEKNIMLDILAKDEGGGN